MGCNITCNLRMLILTALYLYSVARMVSCMDHLNNYIVIVARVVFGSFYRVTGNGYNDIEFRFVDFEHAEIYLGNAVHDISCHFKGNHCL